MIGLIEAYQAYDTVDHGLAARADAIISGLSGGNSLGEVVTQRKIEPAEVLAGYLWAVLGTGVAPRLELRRGSIISSRFATALGPDAIGKALNTTRDERFALSAGLLQSADAWEASHEAAQAIETGPQSQLGAWWHAIAHRREPDAFNANYWVRRAGTWPEVANRIVLAMAIPVAKDRFVTQGQWQPDAFFAAVARCEPGSNDEWILKQWQRIEILGLIEATWQSIVS